MKFKVGDRVKTSEGWVGVIEEITPNGLYWVRSKSEKEYDIFCEEELSKPHGKKPKSNNGVIGNDDIVFYQKPLGYTISTLFFKTKEEAERQLEKWMENGEIYDGTKVFQVIKVYKPGIKLEEKNETN